MNKNVKGYLDFIQQEYNHPVQTRPKPKPGITKEKPKRASSLHVRGPSGSEVDLEQDKDLGYDFRNFSQADYKKI